MNIILIIGILLIVCFICMIIKDNFKNSVITNINSNNILINILTRTGRRYNYFKTLEKSIQSQTHYNIRHIKSNDNPECNYLNYDNNTIKVKQQKRKGVAFYNLYLNEMADKIIDGWVIILDDDCKLIDNNFISKLANECKKTKNNEIIIYQIYMDKNFYKYPSDINFKNKRILLGNIDMAGFCCHYTVFKKFKFTANKAGDFNFLNKIQKNKNFNFKFVTLPIGIHANYNGWQHGSDNII